MKWLKGSTERWGRGGKNQGKLSGSTHRRSVKEDVQEPRVPFLRISDFGQPWDLPCRSPFIQWNEAILCWLAGCCLGRMRERIIEKQWRPVLGSKPEQSHDAAVKLESPAHREPQKISSWSTSPCPCNSSGIRAAFPGRHEQSSREQQVTPGSHFCGGGPSLSLCITSCLCRHQHQRPRKNL